MQAKSVKLIAFLGGTLCLCLGSALGWTTVGPGIEYQEFTLPDPNNLFVARMDRSNPACTIESSIAQGKLYEGTYHPQTIPNQAALYEDAIGFWSQDWGRRNDVIVAINGDFWDIGGDGTPYSGQIQSGWFAKRFLTQAFCWTLDRQAFIEGGSSLGQAVHYTASGNSQTCYGVNRARGSSELILYTPQYDSNTHTDSTGIEVLVELTRPALVVPSSSPVRGIVRQIRQNAGSTTIPFDHVVLSATGSPAATLLNNVSVGASIDLYCSYGPGEWRKAYAGVGAGEVFLMAGYVTGSQMVRHPRTAIAYNDDHVFFVVCDGRSGVSVGMDMVELANFCKDYLGATWAINQDGGGSSTMVVNGVVKNDPSDGSPRAVANGMMMVSLQPKLQSIAFAVNDTVKTTAANVNVRLGPGTNYASLGTVGNNTQGTILDHSLRGIYAKGYYWWKIQFPSVTGWVAATNLSRVSAGGFPQITQHPADQNVCIGTTAAFSITATGTGTITYQWQKDGVDLADGGHYSGVTTSTLAVSSVGSDDVASYRCTVTDGVGTVLSYSAALLQPRTLTAILEQPQPQVSPPAPYGSEVVFSVVAVGDGNISYQWQRNGVNLSDNGHYAGTTTPALTIHHVTSDDDANYGCRVTAGCGPVDSNLAGLKVITADFDGDGDVDQKDFGHLQSCFTGIAVPQDDSSCWDARLDNDGDVDDADLQLFYRCFSGADQSVAPTCLE